MNNVVLMGRLTRDPEVRYTQGENPMAVGRYTLAVERRFKKEGQQDADFISCVMFGKSAEFAEKYLAQGSKVCVSGRIQTGSYTNKDGVKIYTTDVLVDNQEFAESKNSKNAAPTATPTAAPTATPTATPNAVPDGFMNIPDGLEMDLPFN